MEDNKSLYQICKDATDSAISQKTAGIDGIVIDSIMQDVKACTNISKYSKEWLFNKLIRSYIAVCAAEDGYRSIYRTKNSKKEYKGVYLSKDIMNKGASLVLVDNAGKLAKQYQNVYEDMRKGHSVRFEKGCEISGQMAINESGNGYYTEMTLEDLVEIMLGATG